MLLEEVRIEIGIFWLLEDGGRNADKKRIHNRIIYLESHYYGEIWDIFMYVLCKLGFFVIMSYLSYCF